MTTRKTTRILALTVALTLIPVLALAQPRGGGQRGPGGGPGEGQAQRMERIFDRLDVTDEQRDQLEQILAQHKEQVQPTVEQLETARNALAEQIHAAEMNEEAIRDAAGVLAPLEADLAVSRARVLHDVRGVLTPEQQAEMEQLMERHRARAGAGPEGFGRRGPGKGRGKHARRGF